jgi:hypothetical protein
MARVTRVDNSRKEHICGRGNHLIPKGDSYLTAAPGFRSKPKYRCLSHPFRPSELTTSAASEPLAAVEAFTDSAAIGFDSHEDLRDAWEELKGALEEYMQAREGALEAWENGNSQLEELRDTAQDAYDEAESFDPEDFDEDEPENGEDGEPTDEWIEWDERRAEHLAEQTDEAVGIAEGLSL